MGATYFKAPHWELQEAEAKNLAAAIADVQKHYKVPGLSEEHASLVALAIAVGTVYGPRVLITASGRGRKAAPANPVPPNGVDTNSHMPDPMGDFRPAFLQ